jgi:GntR family transcriptional regulator
VTLNPADSRPMYQQLAAQIRDQIQTGELKPGDRLPTEAHYTERYDVSRNTIRLAMDVLRNEGLIRSAQGKGNFVRAEPRMKYLASLTGSRHKRLEAGRESDTFAQQVAAHGKTPRQVMTVEVVPAGPDIGSRLGLDPEQKIAVRRRVMYADDEPIQLGDSYYPLEIVQGSAIMNEANVAEGTDQVLEDLGSVPAVYDDEITWRMPTSEEATKLHIGPGVPVVRLSRVSVTKDGQKIEDYVVILPGDRNALHYSVDAE